VESPLHQFEVKTLLPIHLGNIDLSFTNSALFMVLAVFSILTLVFLALRAPKAIPGRFQSLVELSYEFVATLLEESTGTRGKKYLPFVFSIFLFVLFVIIFVGIATHGAKFLKLFFPEGAPLIMAPLLVPIELISFLSRPVSLSVRLFANMMAGHTMLKVFALFTISLGLFGVSTIILNAILIGFEFLVAFLQAYVFTVLTCLYLNDAIHLHS